MRGWLGSALLNVPDTCYPKPPTKDPSVNCLAVTAVDPTLAAVPLARQVCADPKQLPAQGLHLSSCLPVPRVLIRSRYVGTAQVDDGMFS